MGASSSKDKQKITPRDRAILDLKVQRDRLKQYQKRVTVILGRETEIAKAHLAAGNKPLALLALKKKKYQEGLLESTSSQLLNLEQLV
jgi:charged multivesicular body protein 6